MGPYKVKQRHEKEMEALRCVTMIDPATSWFEIRKINDKKSFTVAQQVELAWLTRYPWPDEIIYDQGTEFLGDFAEMIKEDYPTIIRRPITTKNPQANGILERIHTTTSNLITTMDLDQDQDQEDCDPWDGVSAATMFAIRSTYHTTLQATPAQLVFGRDAILNVQFEADWNIIKANKQKMIKRNNQIENSKRIAHVYHVGDKVLLKNGGTRKAKYGEETWSGLCRVRKVNDNGTVVLKVGTVIDTFTIRRIKPYNE